MPVLCYMSLSFGCGHVCSCERAGCVLRNFIFIRSHVLVLVFTSCVGGGEICFVEELWLWM